MEKKDNKYIKKIIVNGITFTRVLATFSMPFLVSSLTATQFLLLIGSILLTDFVDGQLARRFGVSTMFGSLLDMGSDKLFGMALLLVLSFTYPVMAIPLALELGIGYINTKSVLKGNKAKSSMIGKSKMWIVGLSTASLLMIGATPEISEYLSNVTVNPYSFCPRATEKILDYLKKLFEFVNNNKEIIANSAISASIISETVTLGDYVKDYNKVKDYEKKKLIDELKRYKKYLKEYGLKDYMKEVMINEEYHEQTNDDPLVKKLMPNKNKRVDK